MEKTIDQLNKELNDLRSEHKALWQQYGSELCAGDMIRKEERLERKIKSLTNDTTGKDN